MGKFKSINYSRVVCEDCGQETIIEPGMVFSGLNCKCEDKKKEKAEELATPFNEIKLYTKEDGTTVELMGEFENGDVEVQYEDGTKAYRIPKETFEAEFTEVTEEDQDEEETETNPEEVVLSLEMLQGKTAEEIAAEFTVDALKVLARSLKIRGASQMNEDKLVEKLLEKLGE